MDKAVLLVVAILALVLAGIAFLILFGALSDYPAFKAAFG